MNIENEVKEKAIGEKEVEAATQTLIEYKRGKSALESRIVEEEKWWRLRHWDTFNAERQNTPQPVSAWLFNSISNKHADAMDNYPEPNVLPRERQDESAAETLSAVLPVIMERNKFEQTYSDAWWYKLKHGAVAYGTFWNNRLEDGIGDIDITYIDLLNIFWEPGINNIQDSRNLFVVSLADSDVLESEYPELKGNASGGAIDIKEYSHDDTIDRSGKCVVVDWYYKKTNASGKVLLHYCKFANGKVLFATENEPQYTETGWYSHGKYPITIDVLYPEEGTPAGFGMVAIMKDPQMYIDKLSQLIIQNAAMRSTPRYFAREGCGINETEFLGLSRAIVHVEGSINEEQMKRIDVDAAPTAAFDMLKFKIDELKETSSNRDVSQGGSSSGITAAAAISALQEAGNKTSRDMILSAYRAYTDIMYTAIELIRQFYTESRCFRITGTNGEVRYEDVSNINMGVGEDSRKPIFDIVIKPQKRSAYSKLSQNELAKEMYNMGFFSPQNAEPSLAAVEMMDFDGKQKVKERIQKGQTLYNQVIELQQQIQKMGIIIQQLTGENVTDDASGAAPVPDTKKTSNIKSSVQNESYGERIAKRAITDVHDGGNV